jgi:hypothetical protein
MRVQESSQSLPRGFGMIRVLQISIIEVNAQAVGQTYNHADDRHGLDFLPKALDEVVVYLDDARGKVFGSKLTPRIGAHGPPCSVALEARTS